MEIVQLHQPEFAEYRETIGLLLMLCVTESFSSQVTEDFYTEKLNSLDQYLKEQKAYLFAAKDGNEVVGFLWACELNSVFGRKFHVLYFAVKPEYQGQGLGALLLEKAEEQAKALSISQIELIVSNKNTDAFEFYSHRSYQTERSILTKRID